MDNVIGNRLKQLRIDHQLTMEMMAEDFNDRFNENLNTSQISRWENGKTDPGLSTGKQLAIYYNVSLDYLIGLTDVKTPARLLASANKKKSEISHEGSTLKLNHVTYHVQRDPSRLDIQPMKDDDDFEFEFLNMDDDDKKGKK